ncbi:hypothetical protein SteCoe_4861 [Stentor coeruleus]|uniref:Uncharacterized protein n=1 Tax=Stentor coeruleus TaxID=5963 RepID=A0A1R2CTU1_9CILI|nr:hypothetical protein SteCoe_4861 [Stentor coeruleus]
MVKLLSLIVISFLICSPSAYFHPKLCMEDTIALETQLLKMATEFASLGLFEQGIATLKTAWKIVPQWLIDCVPFIAIPDQYYEIDSLKAEDLGENALINGIFVYLDRSITAQEFKDCISALKYFTHKMTEISLCLQDEDFQKMADILMELGQSGYEIARVCEKESLI